ncbi:AI-2E family transporter [Frigoribacterium sp. CFBP 13707]|uniref:AI-2E family transporter n=1 Tax=Frigoribacterium sp. CFBP 13707 TaxID=2775313 RepID=UPI001FCE3C91|nr:AI-2E family transporter [Frigoribacterium sp. CFBP 13707]
MHLPWHRGRADDDAATSTGTADLDVSVASPRAPAATVVPEAAVASAGAVVPEARVASAGAVAPPAPSPPAASAVPPAMQLAGAWGWRLLVVAGCLAVAGWLIATLEEIVVPLLIAILICALLQPVVRLLTRRRLPHWLAIVIALLGLVVVVGGLLVLVVTQVRAGADDLTAKGVASYDALREFLRTSPLQLTDREFDQYVGQAGQALQDASQQILSGVAAIGSAAGHVLAGGLLTLFATIFLLIDGRGVWHWVVALFPRAARPAVDGAGLAGWQTLASFVRVQVVVAAANAVGIGLFAAFLGLPLAIPIAILVFLASFIPVIGAIVTGALAVLLALVVAGPVQALVMLGGVLLVHLLEAHVLQPLVMGGAVRVHPLAVVFAVATGSLVAGIPGALFAVPTAATVNVMVKHVASGRWRAAVEGPALPDGTPAKGA